MKSLGRLKSIEQGASTTVWAAVAKELDGKGGLYLENCSVGVQEESSEKIWKEMLGYRSYALDAEKSDKFWDLSVKLTKKQ